MVIPGRLKKFVSNTKKFVSRLFENSQKAKNNRHRKKIPIRNP